MPGAATTDSAAASTTGPTSPAPARAGLHGDERPPDIVAGAAIATTATAYRDVAERGDTAHRDADDAVAHLAQLVTPPAATTPGVVQAPAPAPLALHVVPGQPQFAQDMAQNVAWMVGQGVQRAQIQVSPPELGPIQVEITTHHDHIDVSFAVQHPQTVNALQQTLPQLHDMLAQQGLNLGHASVGHQAPGQSRAAPGRFGGDRAETPAPELARGLRRIRIRAPGRVDDFA